MYFFFDKNKDSWDCESLIKTFWLFLMSDVV